MEAIDKAIELGYEPLKVFDKNQSKTSSVWL
jgi:hypothetical protein